MKHEPRRRTRKGSEQPKRLPNLGSRQDKQTNRRSSNPQKQRQMDHTTTRTTHRLGCCTLRNRKPISTPLKVNKMQICLDCGQPLIKVAERLYQCQYSGLYYPVSTRGKLGYPLAEPPASLMQPKEPQKKVAAARAPDLTNITAKEMFKHPKFFHFCLHQYSELSPIEAIQQLKNAGPSTKYIVLQDFINWLQT